jgi:FkbM family methyltransferase
MSIIESAKCAIVSLGPKSRVLQTALKIQGMLRGYRVRFHDGTITVSRRGDAVTILDGDYQHVPLMTLRLESYFNVESEMSATGRSLDFSRPAVWKYLDGVQFSMPGIPEDDAMPAYLHKFRPTEGMIVWDVGAHAGMTTYHFSKLVGKTGHVYAFEPDDVNREHLMRNLARHALDNVTVRSEALGERTGKAIFAMTGSMVSGLAETLRYSDPQTRRKVSVLSMPDCCQLLGCIPDYVKMDIEGAEIGVIRGALAFLKVSPVHFAIESLHWTPSSKFSCFDLEPLFRSIGYFVESSDQFGTMCTWAGSTINPMREFGHNPIGSERTAVAVSSSASPTAAPDSHRPTSRNDARGRRSPPS